MQFSVVKPLSVCFFIFISIFCFAQNSSIHKIDPALLKQFSNNKQLHCLITFTNQADVSDALRFKSKDLKASYVYNKLKKTSDLTQKDVIGYLVKENVEFRSFLIVNAIAAKATLDQIQSISQFNTVKSIDWDPDVRFENPEAIPSHKNLTEAEWGIQMINADSVWQLGFQGQNVTIGGQDTGYEWDHPALKLQYKGLSDTIVDHNYNWHDAIHEINPANNDSILDPSNNPCGVNSPFPCDDHNHGTHTMGTMVGIDSSNLIGVAPLSKWIACRNMERGTGKPSTYLECFEWFLAPTDLEDGFPNPSLAPDVINNSWSCPFEEGCNESNWTLMQSAIVNLKAAGVFVVVSAGNSGAAGCGSVSAAPAFFEESFSIGATRFDDNITGFSSRGPVTIDSSFRIKPDVTAPGHQVRSCIRNGQYASFNGTSMAGPHVAGAVALIISANPSLRGQVEVIENILKETAVVRTDSSECLQVSASGLSVPNHIYGYGRIDALAAVEQALSLSSSNELEIENPWTLFPNPGDGNFQLSRQTPGQNKVNIKVFDVMGRLVHSAYHTSGPLDLNFLNNGIFYLQLQDNDLSQIIKFVVSQ